MARLAAVARLLETALGFASIIVALGSCRCSARIEARHSTQPRLIFDMASVKLPAGAKVTAARMENREAARRIIEEELSIYPPDFLERHLLPILVVGSMRVSSEEAYGMATEDLLIICVDHGVVQDLRDAVHHELAHSLYFRHMDQFPTSAWPTRQTDYLSGDEAKRVPWMQAIDRGFVDPNAMTSLSEDIAYTWSAVFGLRGRHGWIDFRSNSILLRKLQLIRDFARRVDPSLNDDYLRQIPRMWPLYEAPR